MRLMKMSWAPEQGGSSGRQPADEPGEGRPTTPPDPPGQQANAGMGYGSQGPAAPPSMEEERSAEP